jgi:hypothetical protein
MTTLWTIREEVSIRHRPIIDTGARGRYGGLELTVRPGAGAVAVESRVDDDPAAARWLPALAAGFADYEQRRAGEGRPIGGVVLVVTRVHHHPLDTDALLMRRLAAEALRLLFERHEQPIAG